MVSKSKRVRDATLFSFILVLLLVGFGNSDLSKDREECAEKLMGLASCVPYVGGEAKTPTIDCCSGLKVVLEKSKKCICILIKDRDDPNLGIKINATLAIQLPSACHAPANISHCVGTYSYHLTLFFSIFSFSLHLMYHIMLFRSSAFST